MKPLAILLALTAHTLAADPGLDAVSSVVAKEKDSLISLYQHLHANPELSFQEEKTSQRVAEEMRKIGLEVTEKVHRSRCAAGARDHGPAIRQQGEDEG